MRLLALSKMSTYASVYTPLGQKLPMVAVAGPVLAAAPSALTWWEPPSGSVKPKITACMPDPVSDTAKLTAALSPGASAAEVCTAKDDKTGVVESAAGLVMVR